MPTLSNGTIFSDLERPLTHISRSRLYSTSNNSINSKSCMIYQTVPFPVTLSDLWPSFQGHSVIFRPTDALNVLCAQLTCDLFAIAKFLFWPEYPVKHKFHWGQFLYWDSFSRWELYEHYDHCCLCLNWNKSDRMRQSYRRKKRFRHFRVLDLDLWPFNHENAGGAIEGAIGNILVFSWRKSDHLARRTHGETDLLRLKQYPPASCKHGEGKNSWTWTDHRRSSRSLKVVPHTQSFMHRYHLIASVRFPIRFP